MREQGVGVRTHLVSWSLDADDTLALDCNLQKTVNLGVLHLSICRLCWKKAFENLVCILEPGLSS